MSQIDKKIMQKALVGASMLATSPAWAKGGTVADGGKTRQLGVNDLLLDAVPGYNATVCVDPNANATSNELIVAVDDFSHDHINLQFVVRDIIPHNTDYVAYLAYSTQKSHTSELTPLKSKNKLELDPNTTEIVAAINVPAQKLLSKGSTSLGSADLSIYHSVSFSFNLDTSKLSSLISNNSEIYFQAALLTKSDFEAGKFDHMILSELDTFRFVNNCPSDRRSLRSGDGSKTEDNTTDDAGTKSN